MMKIAYCASIPEISCLHEFGINFNRQITNDEFNMLFERDNLGAQFYGRLLQPIILQLP